MLIWFIINLSIGKSLLFMALAHTSCSRQGTGQNRRRRHPPPPIQPPFSPLWRRVWCLLLVARNDPWTIVIATADGWIHRPHPQTQSIITIFPSPLKTLLQDSARIWFVLPKKNDFNLHEHTKSSTPKNRKLKSLSPGKCLRSVSWTLRHYP